MDITEILAQLPDEVADSLQLKLEDCAVSTHLTPEEAFDILDDVIRQLHSEHKLSLGVSNLLHEVPDAIVRKIFNTN